jgi:uncharacterized BrkB/YihY/UPF0761 family membrane protein
MNQALAEPRDPLIFPGPPSHWGLETGAMAELWSPRGLSWREWIRRTCRRSWQDEVFGQAARLAFYYFLAISLAVLLLLLLLKLFASTGSELSNTILDSFQQVLPQKVSALIAKTTGELNSRAAVGVAPCRQP